MPTPSHATNKPPPPRLSETSPHPGLSGAALFCPSRRISADDGGEALVGQCRSTRPSERAAKRSRGVTPSPFTFDDISSSSTVLSPPHRPHKSSIDPPSSKRSRSSDESSTSLIVPINSEDYSDFEVWETQPPHIAELALRFHSLVRCRGPPQHRQRGLLQPCPNQPRRHSCHRRSWASSRQRILQRHHSPETATAVAANHASSNDMLHSNHQQMMQQHSAQLTVAFALSRSNI